METAKLGLTIDELITELRAQPDTSSPATMPDISQGVAALHAAQEPKRARTRIIDIEHPDSSPSPDVTKTAYSHAYIISDFLASPLFSIGIGLVSVGIMIVTGWFLINNVLTPPKREKQAATATALPAATASAQQYTRPQISQGLPEGLSAVYRNVPGNNFSFDVLGLRTPINVSEAETKVAGLPLESLISISIDPLVRTVRLLPDGATGTAADGTTATLDHIKRTIADGISLAYSEPDKDHKLILLLLKSDGSKIGEIKNAYDPVFFENETRLAYLNPQGLFTVNYNGNLLFNEKRVADLQSVDAYGEYLRVPNINVRLRDAKGYRVLLAWQNEGVLNPKRGDPRYSDFAIVDANTGLVRSINPPSIFSTQVKTSCGAQLSPDGNKIYYTTEGAGFGRDISLMEFDIPSNSASKVLARFDYRGEAGQDVGCHMHLSSDGRFLAYDVPKKNRIEVVELQTGNMWQIHMAGAPFDIK